MLAPETRSYAKIRVVGVGGGGSNAVNRMIEMGVEGVEFLAVNTDAQALDISLAPQKLQIGSDITKGLGAGGDPTFGRMAADESKEEIRRSLEGCEMVFVTCGMGGGTGTGASPVIAEIAKSLGALTVGVVTRPFTYEGARRKRQADMGIDELREHVDSLIVIPNDRLFEISEKRTTLEEAFRAADDILRQGVEGISEVIVRTGLINLDFADVRTVLANSGTTLMGIGRAEGENRAVEAARQAISSPLLETTVEGATRILMNVTGGPDLTLAEVHEAAETISEAAGTHPDDVYFGAVVDEGMGSALHITVMATGFDQAGIPLMPGAQIGYQAQGPTSYETPPATRLQAPQRVAPASGTEQPSVRTPSGTRPPLRTEEGPAVHVHIPNGSHVRPASQPPVTQPQGPEQARPVFPPPEPGQPPRLVPPEPHPDAIPAERRRNDDLEVPAFLRRKT